LDLVYSMIENSEYKVSEVYDIVPEFNRTRIFNYKENTSRIGPIIRIGMEGNISEDFYYNFSGGMHFINLIGRDNNRRELFTPTKDFEKRENFVPLLHFSFMIQYKI